MYKQIFIEHAGLLKALANPKRLEIIQLLRDQELSVGQIQEMLDLPQANLSQHLQVLRQAQVVTARKEGKNIYYKIAHLNFLHASDLIREILIKRHQNDDLVDELVLKMSDLVPLTHDPVCGMRLSPRTAAFAHKYKNKTYYFCAKGCLKKFKLKPTKYLNL